MATAVRSTIEAYLGRRANSLLWFHSPKIASLILSKGSFKRSALSSR